MKEFSEKILSLEVNKNEQEQYFDKDTKMRFELKTTVFSKSLKAYV
jgi:hypothetical protein